MTYAEWIEQRLATGDPFTACREWTAEMNVAFPELRRVRGTVLLSNGWERDHWWLVDLDGNRVDPTVAQFAQEYYGKATILLYKERDESEPEPTGKCPNCGGYCYTGDTCCSDRCHREYAAYCMGA